MSAQSDSSLRIVLMTDFGAQVVEFFHQFMKANGHRLVAVVTTPGPKNRRTENYLGVVQATPPGIDVIVTTHPKRLATMLQPFKPDLIWVMGFLLVLPEDVIDLPRLGTINTHGGILPKYRGPNPPGWVFRNDEGEVGWTVHRMTAGIDEGPILGTASVQYGDDDDMQSLFPRWTGLLPGLLGETLQRVIAGDPGEPQDETLAGYAGPLEAAWREIDWSRPARFIHNQVRSWAGGRGMPAGVFGEIDGTRQLIFKSRLVPQDSSSSASPGTLIARADDSLTVQCGDGQLQILKWEPAAKRHRPHLRHGKLGATAGAGPLGQLGHRRRGKMSGLLADKVALITGAGAGIGRASALAFATAGARVVVADIDVESGEETAHTIEACGGQALFVQVDVTNAAEVNALVERAVAHFGRLDCAHNNAGILGTVGTILDSPDDNFDRVMDVNVKGVWLCLKAEVRQMLSQGGGAIVNTASSAGIKGGPTLPAYSASKHAVVGLTKSVALAYARDGIRVNAVCPGYVDTELLDRLFAGEPERKESERRGTLLGRFGTAEEIAQTVVWLCSDAASLMTAHALPVGTIA